MSADDRSWMYNRRMPNREGITDEFRRGLKSIVDFSLTNPRYMNGDKIKCPCVKCHNRNFHHVMVTQRHLLTHGFTHGYKRWIAHGEKIQVRTNAGSSGSQMNRAPVIELDAEVIPENMIVHEQPLQGMEDMVRDAAGPEFDWSNYARQEPNPAVKKFVDAMDSAKEKLYPGCEKTMLEAVSELLNIKSDCNISQSAYIRIIKAVEGWLLKGNELVKNFYETKKLVGAHWVRVREDRCM